MLPRGNTCTILYFFSYLIFSLSDKGYLMAKFDVEKLRLGLLSGPKVLNLPSINHKRGFFVKGPINGYWIQRCCLLGKRCLKVGLALWYAAGISGKKEVTLTTAICRRFFISRHTRYRALRILKQAGLVKLKQQKGCAPRVTLIDDVGPLRNWEIPDDYKEKNRE